MNATSARMRWIGLCLACGLAAGWLGGCDGQLVANLRANIDAMTGQVANYEQIVEDLQQSKIDLDAQIAVMPPGPDKTDAQTVSEQYGLMLAQAADRLGKAKAALVDYRMQLDAVQNPEDLLEITATAVGTAIPGPVGVYLILGASTLAATIRAWRNRATARLLAESVQPLVDAADATAKQRLADVQNDAVKRVVDESQGTATKLPV